MAYSIDSDSKMQLETKKIKRSAWTNDDELQLLRIWEMYESELRKHKHKSHVYEKISKELGGKFNAKKVHIKIKNLTQRYRSEVREVGATGESPTKWENFQYVHKIIGGNNTGVESFAFFASSSNSFSASTLLAPGDPVIKTSPVVFSRSLPSSSRASSISQASPNSQDPLNSNALNGQSSNYDIEMLKNMKNLTKQGEEQLQILRSLAQDTRNLSENFSNFLQQYQENEKQFLEYFKKLTDKC